MGADAEQVSLVIHRTGESAAFQKRQLPGFASCPWHEGWPQGRAGLARGCSAAESLLWKEKSRACKGTKVVQY